MKLACLIQAWLPDVSRARLSLHINLTKRKVNMYLPYPDSNLSCWKPFLREKKDTIKILKYFYSILNSRGQFHKCFNAFFIGVKRWWVNFGLKTPVFLATNIEQNVSKLSIFVAHFGILKPNSYYEIKL